MSAPSQHLPAGLRSLYGGGEHADLAARCEEVANSLEVTADEARYVEESTRLQSQSLVWFEQRAGRITSSVAHDVLHTRMEAPAKSLIKKICSDTPSKLNVPAINWGRDKESVARDNYLHDMSSRHQDMEVIEAGLSISKASPYLAASPDGIIKCTCHGTGVLEIKCPFRFKDGTHEEMVRDKTSCLDEAYTLKSDHRYFSQVQIQMHVTGASYCDFCVWLPSGSKVCRVFPDADFLADKLPKLSLFWRKHLLPELLTRSLEISPSTSASPLPHHCSCGFPDKNPMVGCDDVDCPHQWFHWECVGLVREPRLKSWYCDHCKGQNTKKRPRKM